MLTFKYKIQAEGRPFNNRKLTKGRVKSRKLFQEIVDKVTGEVKTIKHYNF